MDIGEGMFSGGYGRYKSDDQRSLSSISSLTSRSVATNRMAVLQRAARQQEVLQSTHKPQVHGPACICLATLCVVTRVTNELTRARCAACCASRR